MSKKGSETPTWWLECFGEENDLPTLMDEAQKFKRLNELVTNELPKRRNAIRNELRHMPYPKRFVYGMEAAVLPSECNREVVDVLLNATARENESPISLSMLFNLGHHSDAYRPLVQLLASMGSSTMSVLIATLCFLQQKKPYYTLTNELVEMLLLTDLGDDLPAEFFQAPSKGISYVELGETKPVAGSLELLSREIDGTGREIFVGSPIEGFYVSSNVFKPEEMTEFNNDAEIGMMKELGLDGCERIREITMIFISCANPDDPDSPNNTPNVCIPIYLPEGDDAEGITLTEMLERHHARWERRGVFEENSRGGLDSSPLKEVNKRLVKMAALALLYINSNQARSTMQSVNDYHDIEGKYIRAAPKKRGKLYRRLQKAMDRIIISSGVVANATGDSARTHASPRPHYRRGHMRMQAYGEGYSKRKVKLILPTLVTGNQSDPKVAEQKAQERPQHYKVK
ncbi:hypothetical protein [Neptuniibacter sp. QD37_11]|uniref:hypothetical protein n=1 Tax=Neptuniibacter sp. QD37_11 TaxID=3398209 RepID=UPI0039F5059F